MNVEDERADPADPAVSPLAHFGAEVRLERERMGMSRGELGKAAHCGYSLVAKIESGKRVPPREFAEACDELFPSAGGRFMRLWPLALRWALPDWFRQYVDLEGVATSIRMFHPHLVPGLVQTEGYARAVLRAGRPTNLDALVTARLERQHVLRRGEPPGLWLILEEGVLRRSVHTTDVMAAQLRRLRDIAETPHHVVQIIPDSVKVHAGSGGPFVLLGFPEGGDVVHVDGFPKGHVLADPSDVLAAQRAYDLLKATASPPDESASLIDSILKDCYS